MYLPKLQVKYFVIDMENLIPEIKYILCFGQFRVFPLAIVFESIRMIYKYPYYPFPYEISPSTFEFDETTDFFIEQEFQSDEDAITYFQLTYCT